MAEKKKKRRYKYISFRVRALKDTILLVLAVIAAYEGVLLSHGEGELWILLLALFMFVFIAVAFAILIEIPFRYCEKISKRFIDGYIMTGAMEFNKVYLTPSYKEQLEKIEELQKSPRIMDMNKRQAQYLALQNQINPHFLYNTLESIRGEALIAGLDSVADMTEALAKFFRYTITKVENLVTVEEELDNCETYFLIQKYRFGERLKLSVEIDEDEREDILGCKIPKLTLQPILENSIIHGTELKLGTGHIRISFERTAKRLLIRISDDGVGMDENTVNKLNRKLGRGSGTFASKEEEKGGIALRNVNNRIHLLFGEEYGMHIYSVVEKGTDVEITVPAIGAFDSNEEGIIKDGKGDLC